MTRWFSKNFVVYVFDLIQQSILPGVNCNSSQDHMGIFHPILHLFKSTIPLPRNMTKLQWDYSFNKDLFVSLKKTGNNIMNI